MNPSINTTNENEWRDDIAMELYSEEGDVFATLKSFAFTKDDFTVLRSETKDFVLKQTTPDEFRANCLEYTEGKEEDINQYVDLVIQYLENHENENAPADELSTASTSTPKAEFSQKTVSVLTAAAQNHDDDSGLHRAAILQEIENPIQTVKSIEVPLPRTKPSTVDILSKIALETSETTPQTPSTDAKTDIISEAELAEMPNIIDPFASPNTANTSTNSPKTEAPVTQTSTSSTPEADKLNSQLDKKLKETTVTPLKQTYKVADPYREAV